MEGLRIDGSVTRVRPPHVRRDLVSRPRLLGLLESGAGRRLTVVSAPAGFGKTALLAEWASTAGRPVAWLSLDEEDRDPATLRADVEAALGELHRPVALVLDGYERIADAPSGRWVPTFVGDAPPTLQIVLSGRGDPPFLLDAFRARGEVLELGADDLRMTDVEAAELLHRAAGGSLAVREMQRQIDRCEGRPAALCLVAYSPMERRVASAAGGIARPGGRAGAAPRRFRRGGADDRPLLAPSRRRRRAGAGSRLDRAVAARAGRRRPAARARPCVAPRPRRAAAGERAVARGRGPRRKDDGGPRRGRP